MTPAAHKSLQDIKQLFSKVISKESTLKPSELLQRCYNWRAANGFNNDNESIIFFISATSMGSK